MPDSRRKFDPEFREGAVRIVRETGKPIAQIARDLGVHGAPCVTGLLRTALNTEARKGFRRGMSRS
jgi:transposase